MKSLVMLLSAVALCAASLAFAQAQPGPATQPAAEQVKPGVPPAPPLFSPDMEKLAFLLGNWATAEQHEAAPGMPAGSSKGRAFFRPGPGSRSLVEQYVASGPGIGDFQGLGIISWDAKKQAYNAYWCDSMTPSGCQPMGTGTWQGKDLVFTGETEQGGKKVRAREVYTDITPQAFTFQMFMGEGPKPAMTIKYTKTGRRPPIRGPRGAYGGKPARGASAYGAKPAPGEPPQTTPAPSPKPPMSSPPKPY